MYAPGNHNKPHYNHLHFPASALAVYFSTCLIWMVKKKKKNLCTVKAHNRKLKENAIFGAHHTGGERPDVRNNQYHCTQISYKEWGLKQQVTGRIWAWLSITVWFEKNRG